VRGIAYCRGGNVEEALELKARYGRDAAFLAGGTDLVPALRRRAPGQLPSVVCDIAGIGALRGVADEGGGLLVGPLTTHAAIAADPLVLRRAPLLAQAASLVGSCQVRAMGTIGGNVCNASPCADTLPALLACDALFALRSPRGGRTLPAGDFLRAPYETALAPDELLAGIRVGCLPPGGGSGFVKLGRRSACSISRMSVAVVLRRGEGGRIAEARVAAGAVAPVPVRFVRVEALLAGSEMSPALRGEAGAALAREMIAASGVRWSTPYKEPVVAALLGRALEEAWGRAGGAP